MVRRGEIMRVFIFKKRSAYISAAVVALLVIGGIIFLIQ